MKQCLPDTWSHYTQELTEAMAGYMHNQASQKWQHRWGRVSWSSTPSWGAISNRWLLGQGRSVFFREVAPAGYPWYSRHSYTHGHKGNTVELVGFKAKHVKLERKSVEGYQSHWRGGNGGSRSKHIMRMYEILNLQKSESHDFEWEYRRIRPG